MSVRGGLTVLVLGAAALAAPAHAGSLSVAATVPERQSTQSQRLPSGLRVVIAPSASGSAVAVAVVVDAGTRMEARDQIGYADAAVRIVQARLRRVAPGPDCDVIRDVAQEYALAEVTCKSASAASVVAAVVRVLNTRGVGRDELSAARAAMQRDYRAPRSESSIALGTLNGLLYRDFPYGHRAQFGANSAEPLDLDRLRAFMRTHYAPSRTVVAAAGAVRAPDLDSAASAFSSSGRALPVVRPPAPVFNAGTCRMLVVRGLRNARLIDAYPTVGNTSPDWYAFGMLGDILGQGPGNRLEVNLVNPGIALAAFEGEGESQQRAPFTVGVLLRPDADVRQARAALDATIQRIASAGVTSAELAAALEDERQFLRGVLERPDAVARVTGRGLLLYDDDDRIATELQHDAAVTAEQIQRIARQYLKPSSRVSLIIGPRPAGVPQCLR